ncbi:MAG: hypothetical protein IJ418_01820 [Clostridia bacterium]|nr:hypothetical protein [Clostridia bacterium]
MKKFLEALIAKKQNTIKELRAKMDASQDINEVRSIGAQIATTQEEIEEARSQLAEINAQESAQDNARSQQNEDNQEDNAEDVPDDNLRSRNIRPGREVASFDVRSNAPQARANMERRAQEFARTGRQSVPATEARAVMVSGGKIATPTEVGGINDAFTQVSSIVDLVKVTDCTGMGAYKVAYVKSGATAAKQTEGAAVAESNPVYDFVTITPETAAVVSYITKQVKKQSPLVYQNKTREQALIALRVYAENLIVSKIKASTLTKAQTIAAIDDKTLRNIVLAYGGARGVEGGATLALSKESLIAFGDVRGTQDKKPVYEITPDTDPNTGTIKDGGTVVKYCLVEGLAVNELLYGKMHCFELGLFGDYEIAVSEDRNIDKLMLTIVGDVDLGGEVVVNEGFIHAKTSA